MNARISCFLAAVLVFALPCAGTAQESNPYLGISVDNLARTWLLRNCGVDDEPLLEIAVARQGAALKPVFLRAWQSGPPEKLITEVREAASARFERNRIALADPESLGLSSVDLERATSQSAERYVTRAVESLDIGYRSQALRGLYFTGGDEGRKLLEQVSTESDSPFGDAARLILKRDDAR